MHNPATLFKPQRTSLPRSIELKHKQLTTAAINTRNRRTSAIKAVKEGARIAAPSLLMIGFAVVAHAQTTSTPGDIDTSVFKNVSKSAIGILEGIGSTVAVGGFLFAAYEWYGQHDKGRAVGALIGGFIGAIITGAAVAWGASLAAPSSAGALQ